MYNDADRTDNRNDSREDNRLRKNTRDQIASFAMLTAGAVTAAFAL